MFINPRLKNHTTRHHHIVLHPSPVEPCQPGRSRVDISESAECGRVHLVAPLEKKRAAWGVPSGYVKIAMENGPLKGDFSTTNGDFLSYLSLPEGTRGNRRLFLGVSRPRPTISSYLFLTNPNVCC